MIVNADSGRTWTPIPTDAEHRFRSSWTPIPAVMNTDSGDREHRFRSSWTPVG